MLLGAPVSEHGDATEPIAQGWRPAADACSARLGELNPLGPLGEQVRCCRCIVRCVWIFGTALQANIGVSHTSSLKMVPKTPNAPYSPDH
jgi:hypothetical protein